MNTSVSEQNYLKAILKLSTESGKGVSTTSIAEMLDTSAASVTDMIKKLHEKKWVTHLPYKGVKLTAEGQQIAANTLRKHRIWEVFLVKTLNFSWDEIHEVAEELEHVNSNLLIERLDEFLGYPSVDPHGDPIPTAEGVIAKIQAEKLTEARIGGLYKVKSVTEDSQQFLLLLNRLGIALGTVFELVDFNHYDNSISIRFEDGRDQVLSHKVADCILVKAK